VKYPESAFVLRERRAIEPVLETSNQIFDDTALPHYLAIHDDSR
jgi:hypothetical protein